MVGRGRVVAILRVAIMRSDSRFDARGGKANLDVAAEKRLRDEQRRDKSDAVANRAKKPGAARVPIFAARAVMGCLVPAKELKPRATPSMAIRVP